MWHRRKRPVALIGDYSYCRDESHKSPLRRLVAVMLSQEEQPVLTIMRMRLQRLLLVLLLLRLQLPLLLLLQLANHSLRGKRLPFTRKTTANIVIVILLRIAAILLFITRTVQA